MRLTLLSAFVAFALDQLSKLVVVHWMNLQQIGQIEVLPPLLTFRMGWNRGVNFGLFANDADAMRWSLIVLALLISAWLLHWARSRMTHRLGLIGAGLIIGGALANALDRVIYGAVADFLNMSCCGIDNPYTFNLADVFIFAGAIALVFFADDTKTA